MRAKIITSGKGARISTVTPLILRHKITNHQTDSNQSDSARGAKEHRNNRTAMTIHSGMSAA